MVFFSLDDGALVARAQRLAREEREVTMRLLRCLEEVERRELHLARGSGSLCVWMCRELGYTEDQAQYRVDAMRGAREVPEAWDALSSGRLSVSHLVKAQRFYMQEKKRGEPLSAVQKRALIEELQGTSLRQCDRKLAERSPHRGAFEKVTPVAGGGFQISFSISAEDMQQIEELRTLHGGISFGDLFKKLAKDALRKMEVKGTEDEIPEEDRSVASRSEGEGAQGVPRSRHVPRPVRRQVWKRDRARCAFVSPETGQECGSTYGLQIDHVMPYATGGSHQPENLRLLCRAHNLYLGRQMFGRKRV